MTVFLLLPFISAATLAALLSACLTWAIRPALSRYALATPNARSSHRIPTPQGAGIAVVTATLVIAGATIGVMGSAAAPFPTIVFGATTFIALAGAADDIRPIPVIPRLLLQALAVGAVIFTIPAELRIATPCPFWVERILLLVAALWFVNLVNFMDGLDWMTAAEVIPITVALILLGSIGELAPSPTIVAAALGGAMVGFAPFNRPIAKLFLGDVGSLPIGLLLGWCLLELAFRHHFAAAFLLPLYYLADATVTLLRRMANGEAILVAHRKHFYQQATDNGFAVMGVVREVFAVNIALATLASISVYFDSSAADVALVAVGGAAVARTLVKFATPQR